MYGRNKPFEAGKARNKVMHGKMVYTVLTTCMVLGIFHTPKDEG